MKMKSQNNTCTGLTYMSQEEFTNRGFRRGNFTDALGEPPRNCDVGTPKEQRVRFITWCENHNLECEDCPLRAFRDSGDCGFAWMQMPYKNEESDASISR